MAEGQETNNNIEICIWKINKFIKALESAKGNGSTSMISLIMTPCDQVSRVSKVLAGAWRAITFAQQRLKLYNEVLPNDLCKSSGLHKFTADLPKKHRRGGQSTLRFDWLRMESRHNYVRKAAELATKIYINPATKQSTDPCWILAYVKLFQKKRLMSQYLKQVSHAADKYVIRVDDTLKALEMGAVETLIVWENMDINSEIIIKHLNEEQEADNKSNFQDPATSAELEDPTQLKFITCKSHEGSQFCTGFGVIGYGAHCS
ncbi:hypothetical protein AQUCO_00400218v1 [Aquilegia coerulea]|uniref:eRF1 domain-containing protein n=1 Tax=Aquilegia coerulea TaxID=218851 RepID=A0A2G5ETY3_AQUCA|nr:hypothetical protein AQUCO_00400218v1 [Aquilegia coerulea]